MAVLSINRRRWTSDGTAMACAIVILLGAAGNRLILPKPGDAAPYHARVRDAADRILLRNGEWIANDAPLPTEAIDELRPNVVISRHLVNVNSRAEATILFVQCRDVRDLAPHYPPICYPGHGLTLVKTQLVPLQIGTLKVNCTRYTFESSDYRKSARVHIDNFMILPDGGFQADMQGMERRIGANQRYFGAAQVQILHSDHMSEAEQTSESEAILSPYKLLIDTISSGVRK